MGERDLRAPRLAYLCLQATKEGQASHAHVHEIIRGLERRGWRVELFEPAYAQDERAPGWFGRLLEFARVQAAFIRAAKRADILYVRAHFAAVPASLWARLAHRAVVQELNGVYEDAILAWPWLRFFRFAIVVAQRVQVRWASLVITVTDGLALWVRREAGHARVAVVPNAANVELFSPEGRRRTGLPSRFVGFVGKLARWQGVEVLLQATQRPNWPTGVYMVVVGDGAMADAVQAAATPGSRVCYVGRVPYVDVAAIVRGALAMLSVQPAIERTTVGGINPLKVYEALACGVPVVVSDHPGQADLVRQIQCGWVVPADDPSAVADAVASAASDVTRAREMGRRGRNAVVRYHSWDVRAAATDELLRGLMERRV